MAKNEDGTSELRSNAVKRAIKSANQKLCQSTHPKNPVIRYGYKDYMAHHYAYMVMVMEVHEPDSYAEAAKDVNWHAVMEKNMRTLVENEKWDLVDAPKGVKSIKCKWVYKVKYKLTTPSTDTRLD